MSWSSDSTQIACGCGSGQLVIGNLIERRLEWRHFEITLADSKQIKVRNCENDAKEELDLKDRVIKMSAGFGYLIVITPTQCNIYRYILKFVFLPIIYLLNLLVLRVLIHLL